MDMNQLMDWAVCGLQNKFHGRSTCINFPQTFKLFVAGNGSLATDTILDRLVNVYKTSKPWGEGLWRHVKEHPAEVPCDFDVLVLYRVLVLCRNSSLWVVISSEITFLGVPSLGYPNSNPIYSTLTKLGGQVEESWLEILSESVSLACKGRGALLHHKSCHRPWNEPYFPSSCPSLCIAIGHIHLVIPSVP